MRIVAAALALLLATAPSADAMVSRTAPRSTGAASPFVAPGKGSSSFAAGGKGSSPFGKGSSSSSAFGAGKGTSSPFAAGKGRGVAAPAAPGRPFTAPPAGSGGVGRPGGPGLGGKKPNFGGSQRGMGKMGSGPSPASASSRQRLGGPGPSSGRTSTGMTSRMPRVEDDIDDRYDGTYSDDDYYRRSLSPPRGAPNFKVLAREQIRQARIQNGVKLDDLRRKVEDVNRRLDEMKARAVPRAVPPPPPGPGVPGPRPGTPPPQGRPVTPPPQARPGTPPPQARPGTPPPRAGTPPPRARTTPPPRASTPPPRARHATPPPRSATPPPQRRMARPNTPPRMADRPRANNRMQAPPRERPPTPPPPNERLDYRGQEQQRYGPNREERRYGPSYREERYGGPRREEPSRRHDKYENAKGYDLDVVPYNDNRRYENNVGYNNNNNNNGRRFGDDRGFENDRGTYMNNDGRFNNDNGGRFNNDNGLGGGRRGYERYEPVGPNAQSYDRYDNNGGMMDYHGGRPQGRQFHDGRRYREVEGRRYDRSYDYEREREFDRRNGPGGYMDGMGGDSRYGPDWDRSGRPFDGFYDLRGGGGYDSAGDVSGGRTVSVAPDNFMTQAASRPEDAGPNHQYKDAGRPMSMAGW